MSMSWQESNFPISLILFGFLNLIGPLLDTNNSSLIKKQKSQRWGLVQVPNRELAGLRWQAFVLVPSQSIEAPDSCVAREPTERLPYRSGILSFKI